MGKTTVVSLVDAKGEEGAVEGKEIDYCTQLGNTLILLIVQFVQKGTFSEIKLGFMPWFYLCRQFYMEIKPKFIPWSHHYNSV